MSTFTRGYIKNMAVGMVNIMANHWILGMPYFQAQQVSCGGTIFLSVTLKYHDVQYHGLSPWISTVSQALSGNEWLRTNNKKVVSMIRNDLQEQDDAAMD